MAKRNLQNLYDLLEQGGNKYCADCSEEEPQWASANIGVFICVNCSGIHRMLGVQISRVRSLRLDQWSEENVRIMSENGNDLINSQLEKYIPAYYHKPKPSDPQIYREHFIYAKYEQKIFTKPETAKNAFEMTHKKGFLMKRGKKDKNFRSRLFQLDNREGTLKYFIKPDAKDPKHVISLSNLHVSLAPEKINHQNGLQISFSSPEVKTFRHIYLYCEESKDSVCWYLSLRAALYNILKQKPNLPETEILRLLDSHHVKQGFLYKTGPKKTEPFRKRWFSLENRRLIYFLSPLDAYPKGEIIIGNASDGYSVQEGWGTRKPEKGHGIVLNTPTREFLMFSDDKEEQVSWICEIKSVLARPMSAKDIEELESYSDEKKQNSWLKGS